MNFISHVFFNNNKNNIFMRILSLYEKTYYANCYEIDDKQKIKQAK